MQYKPLNQMSISGLEKGSVICYEVKSCKEDYHSGNGLNYEGDKNYIVTTMECYKDIVNDVPWSLSEWRAGYSRTGRKSTCMRRGGKFFGTGAGII